jgi:DNA (cytosine-5)-methyltransferase 1
MTYRAVDCMGFAGGFTLGVVQGGFELVAKREEPGGFGVANCEANRHLLGHDWKTEVGEQESWSVVDAELVFGNPPCSGFSVMTDKRWRGIDSRINVCMHNFTDYVARVRPQVSVMESVRPAYTKGRPLMQALRDKVERETGLRYDLYHVFQDAYDLGGAAKRPRYFMVMSQVPFGVDWPTVTRRPLLREVWEDLDGLANTWLPQPYRRPANWWTAGPRGDVHAVDGHVTIPVSTSIRRALDLLQSNGGWPAGWWIGRMAQHIYETQGKLPPTWSDQIVEKLVKTDWHMGYIQLSRWDGDRPARVITGGALGLVLHPWQPRTITHREAARVMGFPDDWRILPLRNARGLPLTWGKGITTQCGRWISTCVRHALDGRSDPVRGDEIGDRERLIKPPK